MRRHGVWVEVEIRTDILFASGEARLSTESTAVLRRLAATLKPFPNPIRVEGHTDNVPIKTREFRSNWSTPRITSSTRRLALHPSGDPADVLSSETATAPAVVDAASVTDAVPNTSTPLPAVLSAR